MFQSLTNFFRRLFGMDSNPSNEIVEEANHGMPDPENYPEDGSDVFEVDAIGTRAIPETSTRSLDGPDVAEVIDMTEEESSPTPVMITAPRYLWCLDNGHGKLQKGKRSPHFEDGTQFEEWEFNRAIVRGIIEKLAPSGIQFYNVVPEDEIGRFLAGRVKRANNKTSDLGLRKIFVSVHANAAPLLEPDTFRDDIEGIETFHYPRSTSGSKLATVFHKHIIQKMGWRDRGVKTEKFYVLANTSMPAVLTENGFYTSEPQARDLLKTDIRQKIIDAHCDAILEIEKNGI